jgi:hypothetical protein
MNPIFFHTTDWSTIPFSEHAGESGTAYWRTIQYNGLRVRLVEYSKGYKADHWCNVGHLVFCLEGEMIAELSDGRSFTLSKGMSYLVSDNVSSHRSTTEAGVKLLIVDGQFLNQTNQRITNPWKI